MNSIPALIPLDPQHPEYASRLVEHLLELAVQRGASDIHLQPRADHLEILLRIDGVLQKFGQVPSGLATNPVARLLVLANLPTYQSQKPLEGRLSKTPTGVEMRLGTFPTLHGTRAVVRLMKRDDSLTKIFQLGLPDDVSRDLSNLTACQDGAILLTGPAGSGKTTTLYACLREIAGNEPRRSIVTLEDPIESVLDGVSQSQIVGGGSNGMTLASALRSVLRQDPEVLLVGEIRDEETAAAAFGASLTGHLVYSSLHASDVATALRRLVEMGIPPYLIRSGLRAICSQRLLRRLCPNCKRKSGNSEDEMRSCNPVGCENCGNTGYRGRLVVAEILRLDTLSAAIEKTMDLVAAGQHVSSIRDALAQMENWQGLRMRAQAAVNAGETTSAEVFRVLGSDA